VRKRRSCNFAFLILSIASFSCQTLLTSQSDPPLPPVIDSITFYLPTDSAPTQETVYLSWQVQPQDTVPHATYTIIKKTSENTAWTTVQHNRPANLSWFIDNIEYTGISGNHIQQLYYRIIAYDSLGQKSDTSQPDTIGLSAPPVLGTPRFPRFSWTLIPNAAGYRVYMILWGPGGMLWKSPRTENDIFSEPDVPTEFTALVPDSLGTLPEGTYTWGVHLEISSGSYRRGAIRINQFPLSAQTY